MTAPTYVLVALDWPRNDGFVPNLPHLLALIGEHVVSVDTGEQSHHRTGEPIPVHRIAVAATLRNTEAHGMGYRCGFVVHIEHPAPAVRP